MRELDGHHVCCGLDRALKSDSEVRSRVGGSGNANAAALTDATEVKPGIKSRSWPQSRSFLTKKYCTEGALCDGTTKACERQEGVGRRDGGWK
jgi:hypothetical protein